MNGPVPDEAIGLTGDAFLEAMAHASTHMGTGNGRRVRWSATDLLTAEFPEPKWAVPGIVAEGLNMLAGSPKIGKSWAALGLALAVASGGMAFGTIPVECGPALYIGLEDPARRLQSRLRLMLAGDAPPVGLDVWTHCDRLPEGATAIDGWLDDHPTARLVVVDVFAKMRPPADAKQSSYEGDYHATRELKRIADERSIAVLFVHHTRKASAEDWLDLVSGTQGLSGACDAILVLKHQRGAGDAELLVTGRDVEESKHALKFLPDIGAWSLLDGPAEDYELQPNRRAVLSLLRDEDAMTPKQVAERLGMDHELAKKTLGRMAKDEQIDTDGAGHYFAIPDPLSPVPGVPGVPDPGVSDNHHPVPKGLGGHEGHPTQGDSDA